ncbi:MAG: efflux RND transporter periplasmic adaptor subunit [Terracidiphilus sp.]
MDQRLPVSRPATDFKPSYPEKKRRHLWIWVIVLVAFGLLFFWVYKQHSAGAAPGAPGANRRGAMAGPVPVTLATATKGSIGIYLDAIGTVTPLYTDNITAQITGVITAVHYREGQYVHKGDPLVDIDDRPYQAQLEQAQGALDRDQNLLAEAQMDLKRYQDAWAKNAIPRQTLEDQEKLALQDQGTVKNDEGTVKYDTVQVDFCHIKSPINGRVGLRLVDPGNLVTANSSTTLVVITQVQPVTVIFTLAEDSLQQVLQQMHGAKSLTVLAYDRTNTNLIATGRLVTVDNQIDTATGTVKLRAEFDNAKGYLYPNEFVNTRLLVKTLDNQTLVPSSAIQHNGATDFVYLVQGLTPSAPGSAAPRANGGGQGGHHSGTGASGSGGNQGNASGKQPAGKAVMRTVKVGISDQGNSVVTSGLNPGDVVANSSFQKLIDGSPVTQSPVNIPSTSADTTEDAP